MCSAPKIRGQPQVRKGLTRFNRLNLAPHPSHSPAPWPKRSSHDPTTVDRWNQVWKTPKRWSVPDEREPYTVVIPPPNVTGVLHMGHMLNNTIQDLVRRARMQGKNALGAGHDHVPLPRKPRSSASCAIRASRNPTSAVTPPRARLDWTREHGGIIKQLRKLGASCDWDRTNFTLDEHYSRSVIDTLDLHAKGHIYRGLRMVNWDPQAPQPSPTKRSSTPRSSPSSTTCATRSKARTTGSPSPRPDRDHPRHGHLHERYTHLHGKRAIVPVAGRSILIILDEYVDREFGTGCLKVTPAHDPNDHELGQKHNLEVIDMLNPDGTVNARRRIRGQDRFEARKTFTAALDAAGHLVKVEDHPNKVGRPSAPAPSSSRAPPCSGSSPWKSWPSPPSTM